MAERVGVIGSGVTGKPIAQRIVAAGHHPASLIADAGIATGHDNPAL